MNRSSASSSSGCRACSPDNWGAEQPQTELSRRARSLAAGPPGRDRRDRNLASDQGRPARRQPGPQRAEQKILIIGATAKTNGWSGYAGAPGVAHGPRRRIDDRAYRPALGGSRLRQPENLGARRLPPPSPQAPAVLPRRVRLPFNRRLIHHPPSIPCSASASPSNKPPTTC
jgi:hypothetical protein